MKQWEITTVSLNSIATAFQLIVISISCLVTEQFILGVVK